MNALTVLDSEQTADVSDDFSCTYFFQSDNAFLQYFILRSLIRRPKDICSSQCRIKPRLTPLQNRSITKLLRRWSDTFKPSQPCTRDQLVLPSAADVRPVRTQCAKQKKEVESEGHQISPNDNWDHDRAFHHYHTLLGPLINDESLWMFVSHRENEKIQCWKQRARVFARTPA